MERRIPARLSAAEGRKFAFTVGGAFLVLTAILVWRGHMPVAYVTGSLGSLLALSGIVIPGKLSSVYNGWMAFGEAISKVTTPIFMGILFYGVLMPAGVLRRVFGGNPVLRPTGSGSYWVARTDSRKSDLQRQF